MSEELPAVTLARIEGKLDLINAGLVAATTRGDDHESRLRVLEAKVIDPDRVASLEARAAALEKSAIDPDRMLLLEARPEGITPAKFMSTLVGFGSLAAALASVVTLLSR